MDCSHTSPHQPVLAVFSEPSQRWILQYLDLLATRRYAPATLTAIVKTLAGLLRYLPQERQGWLAADITQDHRPRHLSVPQRRPEGWIGPLNPQYQAEYPLQFFCLSLRRRRDAAATRLATAASPLDA